MIQKSPLGESAARSARLPVLNVISGTTTKPRSISISMTPRRIISALMDWRPSAKGSVEWGFRMGMKPEDVIHT